MRSLLVATHPATLVAAAVGLASLLIIVILALFAVVLGVCLAVGVVAFEVARQQLRRALSCPGSRLIPEGVIQVIPHEFPLDAVLPTPPLILGHDEHGKGEIITPLEDDDDLKPLTMPSAARITHEPMTREQRLENAVQLVLCGKMGTRAAARRCEVPESTVRARVRRTRSKT